MTQEEITFPQDTQPMNIQEMDNLCKALKLAEAEYKEKKKAATEADARRSEIRASILDQLDRAGMKSFKSNHGTVTNVIKLSYKTPKTTEEKEAFFSYIRENHGEDSYKALQTVNSASLNSFLNEVDATHVPGLEAPVERSTLSFRKS